MIQSHALIRFQRSPLFWEEAGMVSRDIGFLGPASSDHLQEVEFGVKLILPDEENDVWSHLTCEGRCMQKSERVCNYALRNFFVSASISWLNSLNKVLMGVNI
jgi:hypothetical protein